MGLYLTKNGRIFTTSPLTKKFIKMKVPFDHCKYTMFFVKKQKKHEFFVHTSLEHTHSTERCTSQLNFFPFISIIVQNLLPLRTVQFVAEMYESRV